MEKSPATATFHVEPVLPELCGVLFLTILTWSISKIQRLFPGSCQSRKNNPADKVTQVAPVLDNRELNKARNKDQDEETELTEEDIETVMRSVGFNFDQESSMACYSIGSDCVSRLFNDDEPSLEEVRQAFKVFDENNDGYIDAEDLQRVLWSLGLVEGVSVDECEKMIARYDMNKDRRIDVVEFVKVLDDCIC